MSNVPPHTHPRHEHAQYATTAEVVSQAYVDTADALKAPLASPALTGTPTAPTAAAGTGTTQLATTAFVTNAGTWNSYTPQVNQGATTNIAKSAHARYLQFGKLVICRVAMSITGTGTSGQTIYVSLPVTPSYRGGVCGTATVVDSGTMFMAGASVRIDTASDYVFFLTSTSGSGVGMSPAFALASGDWIEFIATYEAA